MHLANWLSLGNALWCSLVTITTAKYVDNSPSTPFEGILKLLYY
ncbi:potassium channel protein [Clostridium acetobutylicum]|nr:potassium channel protein [Clostridium acetobutylicum]